MMMTFAQFPAGSEYRVDWTVTDWNPRYAPFSPNPRARHREIEKKYSSKIFTNVMDAVAHADYIATFSTPSIKVKTPGSKRFIPAAYARKEWVA